MERESQNINTYIVSSQSAPDQAKQSRIVKLSTKQEATVPSKTKKSEESSYFRIAVKPQLTPLNVAKISSSDKIEVKAKSPVFSHNQSDSPSNPSNAPFAQKVAELISKKQEPVDDVYGLERSAISSVSGA